MGIFGWNMDRYGGRSWWIRLDIDGVAIHNFAVEKRLDH